MLRRGDPLALLLCLATPEQKDHPRRQFVDAFQNFGSEEFPAVILVGIRRAGPHGQDSVEQENSLTRPRLQIPVIGDLKSDIGTELLVDVLKRARDRANVRLDGETEAVGVAGGWVWILAEDDDADGGEWGELEGEKDGFLGRKNGAGKGRFTIEETFQFLKVRFMPFGGQALGPGVGNGGQHSNQRHASCRNAQGPKQGKVRGSVERSRRVKTRHSSLYVIAIPSHLVAMTTYIGCEPSRSPALALMFAAPRHD